MGGPSKLGGIIAIFAAVWLLAVPAAAQSRAISPDDAQQIRAVISQQLEAFQADDANRAYGYASASIRQLFPTAEIFMEMVRSSYQPVYRPQSVEFLDAMQSPRGPIQDVYLVGPDGAPVIARYTLIKRDDGSWKISGCMLLKPRDEMARSGAAVTRPTS